MDPCVTDCTPESLAAHYAEDFRRDGYFIRDRVVSAAEVERLVAALTAITDGEEVRRRQRSIYGIRNLLEICPAVRKLAGQPHLRQFVTPVLGPDAFAVRAIFFDKVPGANWALGWHQDSVISVAQRCPMDGYTAWSRKAGVWQVQPPAVVLARMVAVRVYLDDCDQDNGPLRVIPRSHCHGWLDDEIEAWKQRGPVVTCTVKRGGVITMCPLTLHASPASRRVGHRRVIHMEYAGEELPGPLDWNNRVGAARA